MDINGTRVTSLSTGDTFLVNAPFMGADLVDATRELRSLDTIFDYKISSYKSSLLVKLGPTVLSIGNLDVFGPAWRTKSTGDFEFKPVGTREIQGALDELVLGLCEEGKLTPEDHLLPAMLLSDLSHLNRQTVFGRLRTGFQEGRKELFLNFDALFRTALETEYFYQDESAQLSFLIKMLEEGTVFENRALGIKAPNRISAKEAQPPITPVQLPETRELETTNTALPETPARPRLSRDELRQMQELEGKGKKSRPKRKVRETEEEIPVIELRPEIEFVVSEPLVVEVESPTPTTRALADKIPIETLEWIIDSLCEELKGKEIVPNVEPLLGTVTQLASRYLESDQVQAAFALWEKVKALGVDHKTLRQYLLYLKRHEESLTEAEAEKFRLAGQVLFKMGGLSPNEAADFFSSSAVVLDNLEAVADIYLNRTSSSLGEPDKVKQIQSELRRILLPKIKQHLRQAAKLSPQAALAVYTRIFALLNRIDFRGGGKEIYNIYRNVVIGLMESSFAHHGNAVPARTILASIPENKLGASDIKDLKKEFRIITSEDFEARTQAAPAETRVQGKSDAKIEVERNPDSFRALCKYGFELRIADRYAEAIPYYEKALTLAQNHDERGNALYNLAVCYHYLNNLPKALELAEECGRIAPGCFGLTELAMIYYCLGNFEKARSNIQFAHELAPRDQSVQQAYTEILFRQSEELWEDGKYPEALAVAQEIEKYNPFRYRRSLGLIYLKQGKFKETVASLKDACRMQSDNFSARTELEAALYMQATVAKSAGNYPAAIKLLQEIVNRNPQNIFAFTLLSECHSATADPGAVSTFKKRLERIVKDDMFFQMMAYFCFVIGNLDVAIQFSYEVEKKLPDTLTPAMNLAYLYLQKKDFVEAEKWYTEAIRRAQATNRWDDVEYLYFQQQKLQRKRVQN